MAAIYLQRHTRPDVAEGICYGISDLALHSDFEMVDLPAVLQGLAGKSFTKIYSSPLQRCRRLAQRLTSEDMILDSRLMELNFGEWEMVPWEQINATEMGQAWFADYINCKTPNGEAFNDLVARAESFFEEVQKIEGEQGEQGDILVVTHSGFMRAALVAAGKATAREAFEMKIEYGALMVI